MSTQTVTTKTKTEIAAEFAQSFKGLIPEEAPQKLTPEQRLAPYKTQVLRMRRKGFSWRQIATQMCQAPINEKVTALQLKRVFGGKVPRSKAPAKPRKTKVKKKPLPRLVLDRATGLPITPVAPDSAPEAKPSGLPGDYQAVFDQVAGKIIRLAFVDTDAGSELATAACRQWRAATPDQVNDFVLAAQDALDRLDADTAQAQYGITPEQWANWRQPWRDARGLPVET
jgi:hypothetical protein